MIRLKSFFDPPLAIAALFLTLQLSLTLLFGGHLVFDNKTVLMPSIGLAVLILIDGAKQLIRRQFDSMGTLRFLKHWLPLILLIFSYENLRNLTPVFKGRGNITPQLIVFEEWLYGVQPTVWLQNHVHPLLTDFLAISYSLYFIFPFLVTVGLYVRGHLNAYYDIAAGMVLCLYLAFAGYVLFPAAPPRFAIGDQYWLTTISGRFYNFSQSIYDKASPAAHFCAFPSLHVALSTIALLYAWRHGPLMKSKRLLFWTLLPFVVSLWFSTVYLRHHWTGDIIAGWILAFSCFKVSPWITRLWKTEK